MRSEVSTEFRVLKTICDGEDRVVGQLLPTLKPTHFSTSVTQGLFRRIMKLHTSNGEIPNWRDLRQDPGVRPDTRKAMREIKSRPLETKSELNSSVGTLDRLRQVRLLFELGASLEKQLDEEEIDPEEVARMVQSELGKISKFGTETVVTRIGKNGNSLKRVRNLLNAKGSKFISTGFSTFDASNAGFPNSGVVLLAAPTSAGKSTMLDNIIENMAKKGGKVAKFSLEMDADENLTRDLSRTSAESMGNLIDPGKRINQRRRDEIEEAHRQFQKMLAKRGGCIDIIEPGFDPTLEAMLAYCDPFDYDIIAIDYVGLIAGMTGDDQWRAMSNALAYAKRWASRPHKKTMIIFAAQLAADDTLRQSKAMPDHVTNFWHWRMDADDAESNVVLIKQGKCRFGKKFDFPLYYDFEHMTFRTLTAKELQDWLADQQAKENGKTGKGASWKSRGDGDNDNKKKKKISLPEDDDDDYEGEQVQERPKMKRRNKRRSSEY